MGKSHLLPNVKKVESRDGEAHRKRLPEREIPCHKDQGSGFREKREETAGRDIQHFETVK